jgi:hypothetical protein
MDVPRVMKFTIPMDCTRRETRVSSDLRYTDAQAAERLRSRVDSQMTISYDARSQRAAEHSDRGIGLALWLLMPMLAGSGAASAQRLFDPYAGVLVENNSNLFAVAPESPVLDPHGVPRLSDTVSTYRAGADFNYPFDLQRAYAMLEARHVNYERFTNLDHSEYLIDLGLSWRLTSRFDGILDAKREKKIIAFADADLTQLEIQTDQVVKGSFNVAVTPEWRLETQASAHTLDYPIAESPDFRLQEGLEGLGIKYVGIANLAYGIEATHVDGNYEGVAGASDYKQNTYQLAAKYSLRSVTRFDAAIGYTERSIQGSSSSVSGVTGLFGYDRQLTGKTSVDVRLQRAVNTYYTAGSSEIDTSGTVGIRWQATPKIGLELSYQRVRSEFEGQTLQDALTLGRKDNASNGSLEVRYQPLRWLLIRPYVRRQVRESNFEQFTYNDTQVGIELTARRDQATR